MPGTRYYELRLFDRTLVEFSITDGSFSPEVFITDFDESACGLMPCGLALTPDGLWNWLEIRSIPTNRKNAARICKELGFELGNLEALYRTSLGLSLTDSYWVVPRNFRGKFKNYNLFENPFSEAIGALAVLGEARGDDASNLKGNTPELTTDGTLRKGWRIVGDKRVLYKGASEGFVPGEPVSEYIASLIAQDAGLDAVIYGIDTWQGEQCSTCECFTSSNVSYVPFAVATGIADLAGALWWCAQLGENYFEAFCNMLAFDALLCNTDRHFTNFGILRESQTGAVLGLAPVFDNGRALFPNVAENSTEQFRLEAQLRTPSFGGVSFEEQLSHFMGEQQIQFLKRIGQRGIVGNIEASGKRVAALDAFLRQRAEELCRIPVVDHEELRERLTCAMEGRPMKNSNIIRLAMHD